VIWYAAIDRRLAEPALSAVEWVLPLYVPPQLDPYGSKNA